MAAGRGASAGLGSAVSAGSRSGDRGGRLAALLRTIGGTLGASLFLVLGTVVLSTTAVVLSWIPPRQRVHYGLSRMWGRGWLWAGGVRVRHEVEQSLDPHGRYLFMANHASYFDIPALLSTLPAEARFMAKQGLFRVPLLGPAMRALGFIGVDRKDRSQAREALSAAVRTLAGEASVLIFPEGTRSATGRLQEFRGGGFLIALRTGRPIVPVGIEGSFGVQPRTTWAVRPGRIVVRYGRPIETAGRGRGERDDLEREVRERIAALSSQAGGETA